MPPTRRLAPALPMAAGLFALLLLTARPAGAIPLLNGFGGPAGYGTNELPTNDDGFSPSIDMTPAFPMGLNFFGMTHRNMFVNNNGNVSFNMGLYAFTPTAFPVASQPMIAPWWGDVDTRGDGRPARNGVYWYLEPNRIVVTWNNVGYYASHDDHQNDFQLILTTSSTCSSTGDFDVEFRYNRCEWTTGDASGGSGGLGGTPAQVGFDAGNLRDFVSLPMSRTAAILDVCRTSNVPGGAPGLWRFQIRGGGIASGCMGAGAPCTVTGQMGICAQGVTQCAGMGVACVQVNFPRERRCNGFDNDCDGMVDTGDSLCSAGQVCDRGNCVDRCQPELGCLPGQTCSSAGACVETDCLTVTCPQGQRCTGGACVGICDGVTCPHGQSCRAGRCVDPCAGILCNTREVCQGGMCVPACQCRPCATGLSCQPDGYCVADACLGVSCPTGTYCLDGACRDACEHGPDSRLCPSGEVCQLGQCVPGRTTGHPDAGATDGGMTASDASTGNNDSGPVGGDDSGTGSADAGPMDGGSGNTSPGFGPRTKGCSCRVGETGTAGGGRWPAGFALLGLVVALRRRCAGRVGR